MQALHGGRGFQLTSHTADSRSRTREVTHAGHRATAGRRRRPRRSDNIASLRVLQKAGFNIIGTENSYAPSRKREIEETILRLEAVAADRRNR